MGLNMFKGQIFYSGRDVLGRHLNLLFNLSFNLRELFTPSYRDVLFR